MTDVALSGNIFIDTVCLMEKFPIENHSNEITNTYTSIGGIANLLRVFQTNGGVECYCSSSVADDEMGRLVINTYSPIHDIKTLYGGGPTSHAFIICDESKSIRTSLVNWGCGVRHRPENPVISNWHHISYLDALENYTPEIVSGIKNVSKTVTVDFCHSNHDYSRQRIIGCLRFVDGIIASDVELRSLFKTDMDDLCLDFALEYVNFCILHTPEYVLYKDKSGESFKISVKKLEKPVNALGAGDTFCANVIISRLQNMSPMDSIESAIEKTKIFLGNTYVY
jgi:sugar/nucleoside kinase (ribokinase family)